jgi:hypothetical protein
MYSRAHSLTAIRFVLSDAYTSMSREERQALLHEGISTTTTLSAYGSCSGVTESMMYLNIAHSRNSV